MLMLCGREGISLLNNLFCTALLIVLGWLGATHYGMNGLAIAVGSDRTPKYCELAASDLLQENLDATCAERSIERFAELMTQIKNRANRKMKDI